MLHSRDSTADHHPRRIGWLAGIPRQEQELLRFPGVEILQAGSQRKVLRIPPSPSRPTLIAKIHHERDLAARVRRFFGWGRARLEWNNLMRAEERGATVPRPIALECHQGHDIIFTDYLLDTEPFPQHLERYQGERRVALLRVLGQWLASVVRSGIDARDIHTGNILVRGVEPTAMSLWLVDLHDARVGLGVPPHRQRAMVQQVASALGAARFTNDVHHFLEGWAHGARALGIDGKWASGPDRETDEIDWAAVEPERLAETFRQAERAEIQRRRRHISRALQRPTDFRRDLEGIEKVYRNQTDTTGILQVRRGRGRGGLSGWLRSWPTIPRASWFGDRVRQTVWRCSPRASLFIKRCSGEELIVEAVPGKVTLTDFLRQSPHRSRELVAPVLETLARFHKEGIHLDGASAHHWYLDEDRDGFQVRPDPAFIRYRGKLSSGQICEDLVGLGCVFDGSLTPRDRYRGLCHYPGFSSKSVPVATVLAMSQRLGERFAAGDDGDSPSIQIRPVIDRDVKALHRLNEANAPEVGALSAKNFAALIDVATMVRVVDPIGEEKGPAGLLVAMRPEDEYDSPNFLWFCRYFDNFAYVDRVAIAEQARRRGIGSAFYALLEAWARAKEFSSIVCEVNLEPRNEGSLAFHHNYGFREVGQKLSRGKPVMMMQKKLRH
ncbi:MAG: hypothetical protein CMJ95_11050 [Planctomycetes bacterium]|nr:hypothetical protein [Planctomycetota bacterium]